MYSIHELSRITRAYANALTPFIGARVDVPAPDVNTDERMMAWFLDEYERRVGRHEPAVVTGKPLALGGVPGRGESTGRGVAQITLAMLERHGITPEGARVVIQGFGKVGSEAARRLSEFGVRIVGISDISGGLYNPNGLNVSRILEELHCSPPRLLDAYTGDDADHISSDGFLSIECDVLIPAALEGQITSANAGSINARIVVEGANGPTTAEAEEILIRRGIEVAPDILANAGGVVVSYLEWLQGLQGTHWTLETVRASLDERLRNALDDVVSTSDLHRITLRQAAYRIAVERVAQGVQMRWNKT